MTRKLHTSCQTSEDAVFGSRNGNLRRMRSCSACSTSISLHHECICSHSQLLKIDSNDCHHSSSLCFARSSLDSIHSGFGIVAERVHKQIFQRAFFFKQGLCAVMVSTEFEQQNPLLFPPKLLPPLLTPIKRSITPADVLFFVSVLSHQEGVASDLPVYSHGRIRSLSNETGRSAG